MRNTYLMVSVMLQLKPHRGDRGIRPSYAGVLRKPRGDAPAFVSGIGFRQECRRVKYVAFVSGQQLVAVQERRLRFESGRVGGIDCHSNEVAILIASADRLRSARMLRPS